MNKLMLDLTQEQIKQIEEHNHEVELEKLKLQEEEEEHNKHIKMVYEIASVCIGNFHINMTAKDQMLLQNHIARVLKEVEKELELMKIQDTANYVGNLLKEQDHVGPIVDLPVVLGPNGSDGNTGNDGSQEADPASFMKNLMNFLKHMTKVDKQTLQDAFNEKFPSTEVPDSTDPKIKARADKFIGMLGIDKKPE